jgi:hypothetical protein
MFPTKPRSELLQQKEATYRRGVQLEIQDAHEHHVVIRPKMPMWLRLMIWFHYNLMTPLRFKRFLNWTFSPNRYARAYIALTAILGRRVSDDQYRQRQTICGGCAFQKDGFCTECGCGHWVGSRLRFKNKLRGHICPLERHAGTYVGWKLDFVQQGCSSCEQAAQDRQNGNGKGQPHG